MQDIQYILKCLEDNPAEVKNIRNYLLTVLYNAPSTRIAYYRQKARHEMSQYADASPEGGDDIMSRHRNEMPEDIVNRLVNETGWRISFLDSMEDDFSASEEKNGLHAVCGNDNISDKSWLACKQDMIKKEKERFVLKVHTHKIWQQPGKGLWTTYLRKENDKLGKITSKSYEGLIEKLYQHYLEGTTSIVLKDLWPEVMVWKRNQISGKTLKEADRLWKKYYASDPISSKKITEIGMKDWKKFFAKIITANGLTRKQFSEIRTVANYIVRYCILNCIIIKGSVRKKFYLFVCYSIFCKRTCRFSDSYYLLHCIVRLTDR